MRVWYEEENGCTTVITPDFKANDSFGQPVTKSPSIVNEFDIYPDGRIKVHKCGRPFSILMEQPTCAS